VNKGRYRRLFGSEAITLETLNGVIFIFSSLVVLVGVLSEAYPTAFWIASVIAIVTLVLSKQKLALVGAAVGFAAIRFALAALVTRQREVIAAAIISAALFWGIRRLADKPERARLATLVEGRRCPKCGAAVQQSKIVRAVFEGKEDGPLSVINRCPCGEYTLFDESGSVRHVDPGSAGG